MPVTTTNLVTAASHGFKVYEGDTTPAVLTFTQTVGGAAISFAGASVELKIKALTGGAILDTFSTASTDIVISGAGSNVLTISGWERLTVGDYLYDLQSTLAGEVTTYLKGKIKVTADV